MTGMYAVDAEYQKTTTDKSFTRDHITEKYQKTILQQQDTKLME